MSDATDAEVVWLLAQYARELANAHERAGFTTAAMIRADAARGECIASAMAPQPSGEADAGFVDWTCEQCGKGNVATARMFAVECVGCGAEYLREPTA